MCKFPVKLIAEYFNNLLFKKSGESWERVRQELDETRQESAESWVRLGRESNESQSGVRQHTAGWNTIFSHIYLLVRHII